MVMCCGLRCGQPAARRRRLELAWQAQAWTGLQPALAVTRNLVPGAGTALQPTPSLRLSARELRRCGQPSRLDWQPELLQRWRWRFDVALPALAASTALRLFSSSRFCIRSTASFSARGKSGAGSPNFVPGLQSAPREILSKMHSCAASANLALPKLPPTLAAASGRMG